MLKKFDEKRSDLTPYGLTCELWQPNLMRRADRHNEIEINYLPEGSITYLIHNKRFRIERGSTIVFWALLPHQIVDFTKDSPYYVVTIPFSILLEWELPKNFLDIIFQGEVQTIEKTPDPILEQKLFERWTNDFTTGDEEIQAICAIEIAAYLRRFALCSLSSGQSFKRVEAPPINLVEKMAIFIASNFTKPIKVIDVAHDVGLHPDYANSIFKKTFNSTISNYLIEQRVLYAQRKLSVTTQNITSIAYDSGFNSISRFNAAFRKINKMTPRAYRQQHT